jgi:hypothetical protein
LNVEFLWNEPTALSIASTMKAIGFPGNHIIALGSDDGLAARQSAPNADHHGADSEKRNWGSQFPRENDISPFCCIFTAQATECRPCDQPPDGRFGSDAGRQIWGPVADWRFLGSLRQKRTFRPAGCRRDMAPASHLI